MKKIEKEEVLKSGNKTLKEFKKFISRGNAIDLSVGVIMGSSFSSIITSIVDDILMPLIGIVIGGHDFTNLSIKVGNATVKYGSFIQNIVDFLIVSICIFCFIKIITSLTKHEEKQEEVKKDNQIVLLEEIRDLLKSKAEEKEEILQ